MQFGDQNFITVEMLKHQRANVRRELQIYANIVAADKEADRPASAVVEAAALRVMQELDTINSRIQTLEHEALNA